MYQRVRYEKLSALTWPILDEGANINDLDKLRKLRELARIAEAFQLIKGLLIYRMEMKDWLRSHFGIKIKNQCWYKDSIIKELMACDDDQLPGFWKKIR